MAYERWPFSHARMLITHKFVGREASQSDSWQAQVCTAGIHFIRWIMLDCQPSCFKENEGNGKKPRKRRMLP